MFQKLLNKLKSLFAKPFLPTASLAQHSSNQNIDYDEEWYEERLLALRIQLFHLLTDKYKCTTLSYQDMVYGDITQILNHGQFQMFTALSKPVASDGEPFEMVYHFKGDFFRMTMDKKDRKHIIAAKSKIQHVLERMTAIHDELVKNNWTPKPRSPDPVVTTIGGVLGTIPSGVGGGGTGVTSVPSTVTIPSTSSFPPTAVGLYGTTFPSTAVIGDLFLRTDLMEYFFYDGTAWLKIP